MNKANGRTGQINELIAERIGAKIKGIDFGEWATHDWFSEDGKTPYLNAWENIPHHGPQCVRCDWKHCAHCDPTLNTGTKICKIPCPDYMNDISLTKKILEQVCQSHQLSYELHGSNFHLSRPKFKCIVHSPINAYVGEAFTECEAICIACLKTIGVDTDKL